jgi:rhamnose transport system permease protein
MERLRSFVLATLLPWAPLLLPVVLVVVMLVVNPTLRMGATWDAIGRNWTATALLAIALTPVIITGGIDLSVGSILGLAAVAAGFLWRDLGLPLPLALAGGVLTGLAAGMVNGLLVLTRISPLVVTVATLAVFRGLAYGLSGPQAVDSFPPVLSEAWYARFLGVPCPVWVAAIVFLAVYALLHHTWMGRMLYAIGDNAAAARYAAVPVRTLTFAVYALSGLLAGLAGLANVAQYRAAPADRGAGMELGAVACVVLGGVRITGGAGHLAGTLLGTITLAALLEGLTVVRYSGRPLATGLLLVIVAVANEGLARWQARRSAELGRRPRPHPDEQAQPVK